MGGPEPARRSSHCNIMRRLDHRQLQRWRDGRWLTLAPTSPGEGISTILTPQPTSGCPTPGLVVSPPDPSISHQEGEPCVPPLGKARSPVSPLSSAGAIGGGIARVTSDPTFAIITGIAAIIVAAATILTTGREGATPRGEGRAIASLLPPSLVTARSRLGLHSSRTSWPLSKSIG